MENIYATCVDIGGKGVLIIGKSGVGKSDLALRLIENKGAVLVSDDRTDLTAQDGVLICSCPKNIEGLLEVRGVGIMKMPFKVKTKLQLVVEAALKNEIDRFPNEVLFENQNIRVPKMLLDFFEASAPDKIVVKLKALLEENDKTS